MGLISFILDMYENIRKTKTDINPTKPKERKYDYDSGFSGNKKDDYASITPKVPKQTTVKRKKVKDTEREM